MLVSELTIVPLSPVNSLPPELFAELICVGRGHPTISADVVDARKEHAALKAEYEMIDSGEDVPGENSWGLRSPLEVKASTIEAWAKLCATNKAMTTLDTWMFAGTKMKVKPLSSYSSPRSYAKRLKKLAKKTLLRNNDTVTPKARIALLVASILKMSLAYPLALASEVLMFCKDVDEGEARVFHACFSIGYVRKQLVIPPGSDPEESMTPERLQVLETKVEGCAGALGALSDIDPRVVRALLEISYAPDLTAVATEFTKLAAAIEPGSSRITAGPLVSLLQEHKKQVMTEEVRFETRSWVEVEG